MGDPASILVPPAEKPPHLETLSHVLCRRWMEALCRAARMARREE